MVLDVGNGALCIVGVQDGLVALGNIDFVHGVFAPCGKYKEHYTISP
jgi:hypothetical protein